MRIKKKVSFAIEKPKINYLIVWSFAYRQARNGNQWKMCALDRERFKRRIDKVADVISRILEPSHRNRMKNYINSGSTQETIDPYTPLK